jgi:hypothetical protein
MNWQEMAGNWVLIPSRPIGIIHFLGGAFVATAPQITYSWLLEELAKEGYVIIATPFINTFDHVAIARQVVNRFENLLLRLQDSSLIGHRYLPVYGIGHSMGCKLHLLINSLFAVERAGNILISFNNYPVNQAIPFLDKVDINQFINLEFTPSPEETQVIINDNYSIRRNLLIQFNNDNIDQTNSLEDILRSNYAEMISKLTLSGNHLTPLNQKISWQTGDIFTPLDAVAQWFQQNLSQDIQTLKSQILRWLNPLEY